MRRFKLKRLFWGIPIIFVLLIAMLHTIQFRDDDKTIKEELCKKKLIASFHDFINGSQTIHYWDIPNPDKPVVMFVHGSPGSSTALMPIATDSLIAANFLPVLVDRPGFGYSDFGSAEPSLARQSQLLVDILRLYPNKKKILVGHSLGGPLIAKMAMDFPNDISAIIILAGSVDPSLEPKEWFRKPMSRKWIRWIIPTFMNVSNDEILPLRSELESMLPDWKDITIPVVVIQGTQDDLVPKENAAFLKRMLINAPVKIKMLEGDSHFFPFQKPEIVAEELMLLK